ncbi:hypothetical protein [Microcoleus sp. S28C3]|uniref:hypothetical protein n=1 Tax=Microcoleus sp. S28C3 TaxID=3055414 RepID=UPI002FD1BD51
MPPVAIRARPSTSISGLIYILSLTLNRNIELSVSENIASRRVMAKMGMQYEQKVDCWGAN